MKRYLLIVSCSIAVASFSEPAPTGTPSGMKAILEKVKQQCAAGDIAQLEVLYLPTRIVTRTETSRELLEKNYHYKVVITSTSKNRLLDSLLEALGKTKMIQRSDSADLRWACILFDKNGATALSMFFDGNCTKGEIGGIPVSIEGRLNDWFGSNFRNCID